MRPFAALALLLPAACAGGATVAEWGNECAAEMDPGRRLELVRNLVDSADERAIPALIDCLEAVRKRGKTPDRVYGTGTIEPNVTVPAELWGLHLLTGQDFDFDLPRWRAWYEKHQGKLSWDGGKRRFIPRP